MTIFGGVLLYLGLIGIGVGILSLVKPFRFLGIRTRMRGLLVAGLGLLAVAAGIYLPVSETRVETARTRLDEFVPAFQFSEFHTISISASKDRIDAAIWKVTPGEIRFFSTLMWIRFLHGVPGRSPILDTFTAGRFQMLADDPGREIVLGQAGDGHGGRKLTAEEFKALQRAPAIKIAMNFRIEEVDAAHCRLTTETRVYAMGSRAVRGFATYWRMIYPGSSLIRREWLRAIKRRAEAAADASPAPVR